MSKRFKKIRKAILPVGGLGTRFLPATKSIPKEMLPVLDKPLVQYAIDEALEAGIDYFHINNKLSNNFDSLKKFIVYKKN